MMSQISDATNKSGGKILFSSWRKRTTDETNTQP